MKIFTKNTQIKLFTLFISFNQAISLNILRLLYFNTNRKKIILFQNIITYCFRLNSLVNLKKSPYCRLENCSTEEKNVNNPEKGKNSECRMTSMDKCFEYFFPGHFISLSLLHLVPLF